MISSLKLRHFAAAALTATSTVLATGAAAFPQNAQQGSGVLPDVCMKFNDTSRRTHTYDAPLAKALESLKAWSGWSDLEARIKRNKLNVQGLCAYSNGEAADSPIGVTQADASVNLDIYKKTPFGASLKDPADLLKEIENEAAPHYLSNAVYALSAAASNHEQNPILSADIEPNTAAMLMTVSQANAVADHVLFAVDLALRTGNTNSLDLAYQESPPLGKVISAFYTKAVGLKAKGKDVGPAEIADFRKDVITTTLRIPEIRANLINNAVGKLVVSARMGQVDPTLHMHRTPAPREVALILERFSPDVKDIDMVKNYTAWWAAQKDDPARPAIEALKSLQDHVAKAKQAAPKQQP